MAHRKDRQRLWEEILGVANEDLRELEAELAEREDANEDDAYCQAFALWVEAQARLVGASDLEHVRGVCDLAARARAVLAGVLEETPCCFFDPVHGPSARPVLFAPDGGSMKRVLACSACAEALDQSRMPALRKAPVNGFRRRTGAARRTRGTTGATRRRSTRCCPTTRSACSTGCTS